MLPKRFVIPTEARSASDGEWRNLLVGLECLISSARQVIYPSTGGDPTSGGGAIGG